MNNSDIDNFKKISICEIKMDHLAFLKLPYYIKPPQIFSYFKVKHLKDKKIDHLPLTV